MNPRLNEEVMWQRLLDVQREAETRRFLCLHRPGPSVRGAVRAVRELARAVYPRWWARPEMF
jgi:hypothetical protein